jgi:hypothetical protein
MKETGLVFYFEENDVDVWSGKDFDLDAWNYNCKIGGISKVIIINKTSQVLRQFDGNMDICIVEEFPILTGHTTQLVVPSELKDGESGVDLWDFDHQTDWYIIGPGSGWHGVHFGDVLLTIPQRSPIHHHSVFIGATIMFHREHILNNL